MVTCSLIFSQITMLIPLLFATVITGLQATFKPEEFYNHLLKILQQGIHTPYSWGFNINDENCDLKS
jgi:hypothetical protein